jgi:hypothetical protein
MKINRFWFFEFGSPIMMNGSTQGLKVKKDGVSV